MDNVEIAYNAEKSWPTAVVTSGECYGGKANDNIRHAQCWVHTRRKFEEALKAEPAGSAAALDYIGGLYAQEKAIRESNLNESQALAYRQEKSRPIVDAFFTWLWEQRQRMDLLPNDPFTKALQYAHNREHALRVFLTDANVPLDTNQSYGDFWCMT